MLVEFHTKGHLLLKELSEGNSYLEECLRDRLAGLSIGFRFYSLPAFEALIAGNGGRDEARQFGEDDPTLTPELCRYRILLPKGVAKGHDLPASDAANPLSEQDLHHLVERAKQAGIVGFFCAAQLKWAVAAYSPDEKEATNFKKMYWSKGCLVLSYAAAAAYVEITLLS